MEVKATIINSPQSGKLEENSLIELFNSIRVSDIEPGINDFENGIKIDFYDSEENYYGEGDISEPESDLREYKANLYIFNDGNVFYVSKGNKFTVWPQFPFMPVVESDFSDVSEITDKLDEKLGKEIRIKKNIDKEETKPMLLDVFVKKYIEVANSVKTSLARRKANLLLYKVKESIKNKTYSEETFRFDPKTKMILPTNISKKDEQTSTMEKIEDKPFVPQLEWCRKAKYNVQIERACYKIDENHPLLEGFEEKTFDDGIYAVKSGTNELEQNSWTTNPDRPYVITGTVGERWPVKPSNISAYDVNEEDITIEPLTISTKDPSDQEFLVACHIPLDKKIKVISKWAYKDDGSIDESQVLVSNAEDSKISHADGDYIVAKHIDGMPEYMQLPEEQRNTKEAATLYSPRIINGSVMATTYDHAFTQEEIKNKYKTGLSI